MIVRSAAAQPAELGPIFRILALLLLLLAACSLLQSAEQTDHGGWYRARVRNLLVVPWKAVDLVTVSSASPCPRPVEHYVPHSTPVLSERHLTN